MLDTDNDGGQWLDYLDQEANTASGALVTLKGVC
jgi:hypothetical protein